MIFFALTSKGSSLIALLLILCFPLTLFAQQVEGDERWSNDFGDHIEFNGQIRSVAVSGDYIYAEGGFSRVGGKFARGLARWDGEHWQPMTGGICPSQEELPEASYYCILYDVAASGERVYMSSRYKLKGSEEEKVGLIVWDGREWSEAFEWLNTGLTGTSNMIAVGDDVYLAGYFEFEEVEGVRERINGIIKWDGQTWEVVGNMPFSLNTRIKWLAVAHGYLYATGSFFSSINETEIPTNLARWDGQIWETVGTMQISNVTNLQALDGDIYLSGLVRDAQGDAMNEVGIAMWNGTSWIFFDESGVSGSAFSVAKINADLYIQGTFRGEPLGRQAAWDFNVIKWDNGAWTPVTGIGQNTFLAMQGIVGWDDELIIVGEQSIEVLDGTRFRSLDSPNDGFNNPVLDMVADNGRLYVAGRFNTVGNESSIGMAEWDGSRWFPYESTFNGWITHVAASNGVVYAAGNTPRLPYASEVNGQPLDAIAVFDGDRWEPLPGLFRHTPQDAVGDGWITSIEVFEDKLYVGGSFEQVDDVEALGIAVWDGAEWAGLGSEYNFDRQVLSMEYADGALYVGGRFEAGPNAPGNSIAKWDGGSWSAVGNDDFPESFITDLLFAEEMLYATGRDSLYQWDGSSWKSLARVAGNLATMQYHDSTLYVGSNVIVTSDSISANEDCVYLNTSIAQIKNGITSSLGSGTWRCQPPNFQSFWGNEREVWASEIMDGHLYIGGNFTYAGGKPSNYIAKWSFSPVSVPTEGEIPARAEIRFDTPHPNPFTQNIRATFDLSRPSRVNIVVYNLLGQRVAVLMDELQDVGSHEVSWSPGSLPAGLYFLSLQTQEGFDVQKVVYVK